MTDIEAIFIWAALWFYGGSFLFFLGGIIFKKEKGVRVGYILALAGYFLQIISIAVRWNATGHPPVMREYEGAILGSWVTLSIFFVISRWNRKMVAMGVAVMPFVLIMLGNGIFTNPVLEPMAPPFKSNWLWLHIVFAWVAYSSFCIAAIMGALYLLKGRARHADDGFYGRLPESPVLNELMLRMIMFGFVALTVQIGAGSLWAYGLWGRYWGWDPVETWSLITWLIYGIYIHLGATLGWKGRRMAWLAIVSLLSVFITYGGIGYMASVHMTLM